MAAIELVPVLIHYTVSVGRNGSQIHARVRTYAGDRAIEEKSYEFPENALIVACGKPEWTESDLCAWVPQLGRATKELEGLAWGMEETKKPLVRDILSEPTVETPEGLKSQIAALQAALDVLEPKVDP